MLNSSKIVKTKNINIYKNINHIKVTEGRGPMCDIKRLCKMIRTTKKHKTR